MGILQRPLQAGIAAARPALRMPFGSLAELAKKVNASPPSSEREAARLDRTWKEGVLNDRGGGVSFAHSWKRLLKGRFQNNYSGARNVAKAEGYEIQIHMDT